METEVWIIYVPKFYDENVPKFIGVVIGKNARNRADRMANNYFIKHGGEVSFGILDGPVITLKEGD